MAENPCRTFVLPLDPATQAQLTLPVPLTAAQWDRLMIVLDSMRPGLVSDGLTVTEAAGTPAPEGEQ